jgi:hypothetical protein
LRARIADFKAALVCGGTVRLPDSMAGQRTLRGGAKHPAFHRGPLHPDIGKQPVIQPAQSLQVEIGLPPCFQSLPHLRLLALHSGLFPCRNY